ncbi:peptidase M24, partial [Candidatus Marinamargulisbacteria bacterium SCGC AG-343-D04]
MSVFERAVESVFISDGLSVKDAVARYKERREHVLKRCRDITVLTGVNEALGEKNVWAQCDYPLYQDPSLLYLTGLNQSHVALVMNPFSKKQYLGLPKQDKNKEFWEGYVFSFHSSTLKECRDLLGVDDVFDVRYLKQFIHDEMMREKSNRCGLFWYETKGKDRAVRDSHWAFKASLKTYFKRKEKKVHLHNIQGIFESRLCLDKVDRDNLLTANKYSADIFKRCLALFSTYKTETELAGYVKGEIYKASPLGQSFPAIVASGKNAAVLHYHSNNQPLEPNGLVLIDFGLRYFAMPADISRTVPANGVFNPLQKLLYNCVLKTQQEVEKRVKAGVTVSELNDVCWSFLEQELDEKFISIGGHYSRPYKKVPHFVSHLIGHSVHDGDPYRYYRDVPLKEGMVISNEPGLYGEFDCEIDGVRYSEHCGIRIEDDLLVTESGCINLSASCPKTVVD